MYVFHCMLHTSPNLMNYTFIPLQTEKDFNSQCRQQNSGQGRVADHATRGRSGGLGDFPLRASALDSGGFAGGVQGALLAISVGTPWKGT